MEDPEAASASATTVDADALNSYENVEALVEDLKDVGMLPDLQVDGTVITRGKKRSIAEVEHESPIKPIKKNWLGVRSKRAIAPVGSAIAIRRAPITPQRRRFLAYAGLAFVTAATYVRDSVYIVD